MVLSEESTYLVDQLDKTKSTLKNTQNELMDLKRKISGNKNGSDVELDLLQRLNEEQDRVIEDKDEYIRDLTSKVRNLESEITDMKSLHEFSGDSKSQIIEHINNLSVDLGKKRQELVDREKECDTLKNKITEERRIIESLSVNVKELEQLLESERDEKHKIERQRDDLLAELEEMDNQQDLIEEIEELEEEIQKQSKTITRLEKERKEWQEAAQSNKTIIEELKVEVEHHKTVVTQKGRDNAGEIERLSDLLSQANSREKQKQHEINNLKKDIDAWRQDVTTLETHKRSLEDRLSNSSSKLQAASSINEEEKARRELAEFKLDDLDKSLKEKQEIINMQMKQISELKSELMNNDLQFGQLRNEIDAYRSEASDLHEVLSETHEIVDRKRSELHEVVPLSPGASPVKKQSFKRNYKLAKQLKDKIIDLAHKLVEYYENRMETKDIENRVLQNRIIQESTKTTSVLEKENEAQQDRIVHLESKLSQLERALQDANEHKRKIKSQQQEMEKLKDELVQLEDEKRKLERFLKTIESKKQQDLSEKDVQIKNYQDKIRDLKEQISSITKSNLDLGKEVSKMQKKVEELVDENSELHYKANNYQDSLKSSQQRVQDRERLLVTKDEEIAQIREKIDQALQAEATARYKYNDYLNTVEKNEERITQLQEELSVSYHKNVQLQNDLRNIEDTLNEIKDTHQIQINRLEVIIKDDKHKIKHMEENRDEWKSILSSNEDIIRELRESLDNRLDELKKTKSQLYQVQSDKTQLAQQLEELETDLTIARDGHKLAEDKKRQVDKDYKVLEQEVITLREEHTVINEKMYYETEGLKKQVTDQKQAYSDLKLENENLEREVEFLRENSQQLKSELRREKNLREDLEKNTQQFDALKDRIDQQKEELKQSYIKIEELEYEKSVLNKDLEAKISFFFFF
jgi:chromosome segregation ATPase